MESGRQPSHFAGATLALSLCCSFVGGCAIVHVDGAKEVRTTSHFGVVNVRIEPRDDDITLVSTQGAGVIFSGHSGALGWVQERDVVLPRAERCHIVLVEVTAQHAEEVVEVLRRSNADLSAVCVLSNRRKQ